MATLSTPLVWRTNGLRKNRAFRAVLKAAWLTGSIGRAVPYAQVGRDHSPCPRADEHVVVAIDLPNLASDPRVELTFTDAAGRHWRRRDNGELEMAVGDRPPELLWPSY
jgi:hypothetical protein